VRGLFKDFIEQERIAGARAEVDELKRHGDQWRLSEEIENPVTRVAFGPLEINAGKTGRPFLGFLLSCPSMGQNDPVNLISQYLSAA
jgi:hypothetical protein